MIFGNIIRQTLTKTLSIVNEPTGFFFFSLCCIECFQFLKTESFYKYWIEAADFSKL